VESDLVERAHPDEHRGGGAEATAGRHGQRLARPSGGVRPRRERRAGAGAGAGWGAAAGAACPAAAPGPSARPAPTGTASSSAWTRSTGEAERVNVSDTGGSSSGGEFRSSV